MSYSTKEQVRAAGDIADVSDTDDNIDDAIAWADSVIDKYTGVSFEYKSFTFTLDGTGVEALHLPILYPRTLTSVDVDGYAQNTTGWAIREEGVIIRSTGVFELTFPGQNVVVSGTAGKTVAAPDQISWCSSALAQYYLLELTSQVPDRTISMANEFGQFQLALAGGPGRPTALPEVNAILARFREYIPPTF